MVVIEEYQNRVIESFIQNRPEQLTMNIVLFCLVVCSDSLFETKQKIQNPAALRGRVIMVFLDLWTLLLSPVLWLRKCSSVSLVDQKTEGK